MPAVRSAIPRLEAPGEITVERLLHAKTICARIIKRYPEYSNDMLAVFAKLKDELATRQAVDDMLAEALALAGE